MADKSYTVRAARCDHTSNFEEIYDTLKQITAPLKSSWEKIEKAKKIVIKFNMMKLKKNIVYFEGRRR